MFKKLVFCLILDFLAGLFLAAVSGASAVFGFGATVIAAKKRDPKYFGKGILPSRELPETGAILATRALGWGTLYAFTGCGLLFYAIWTVSGAHSVCNPTSLERYGWSFLRCF